jgi:Domain of unknown function (DUF4440)
MRLGPLRQQMATSKIGSGASLALQKSERRDARSGSRCKILIPIVVFRFSPNQLITPTGRSLSGDEYLDEIASGRLKYVLWEPAEIRVHLYAHVGIVRYQSDLEVIANGHPIPRARYWHTDSYQHQNAKWQVVWSQATRITST